MDVEQLLPEAKDCIMEKTMLVDHFTALCKQLKSSGNVDKPYDIHNHS
jgi:hypothetical protein